ncbi:hypothetical protein MKEN_01489800 [Mycena kentingensis (nom. inval.)]|nr:hypothetical protein MKEN_01489800 [Mycena kentingensis (nom. inval.)]
MSPRPPRSTPSPKLNQYPQNDVATYRDLLLFEERLKSTAASLQRQKARYQLFLLQLLAVIAFLVVEVLLPPHISLIAIPCKLVLQRVLPDIYTPETEVIVHPYISTGLLFVSVTTLALFFASGTYTDKIAYANKYVPHANKALRSFNMYLNVRQPPLRSKLRSRLNPFAFFSPRSDDSAIVPTPGSTPSHSRTPSVSGSTGNPRGSGPGALGSSNTTLMQLPTSPQPTPHPQYINPVTSAPTPTPHPIPVPIPPMPPTTNPRGELRFSSRVDRAFRDGYERYRANFERRRALHEQAQRAAEGMRWWWPFGGGAGAGGKESVSVSASGLEGGSRFSGGTLGRSATPPPLPPSNANPSASASSGSRSSTPRRDRDRQRINSGGLAERRGTPPLATTMPTQREPSPPAARAGIQTRASSRRQSAMLLSAHPDLDESGVLRR